MRAPVRVELSFRVGQLEPLPLTVADIEEAVELLRRANVPTFDGGYYEYREPAGSEFLRAIAGLSWNPGSTS